MSLSDLDGQEDHSHLLRKLDPKQRKALDLFQKWDIVTSAQIGIIFGFKPRTSAALCKKWVEEGFLEIVNFTNKSRKYKLAKPVNELIQ